MSKGGRFHLIPTSGPADNENIFFPQSTKSAKKIKILSADFADGADYKDKKYLFILRRRKD